MSPVLLLKFTLSKGFNFLKVSHSDLNYSTNKPYAYSFISSDLNSCTLNSFPSLCLSCSLVARIMRIPVLIS